MPRRPPSAPARSARISGRCTRSRCSRRSAISCSATTTARSRWWSVPWMPPLNSGREPFFFSIYFGVPLLALALFGISAGSARRWSTFWAATAAVSLIGAFGAYTPIYPFVRDHLPVLGSFRFPVKVSRDRRDGGRGGRGRRLGRAATCRDVTPRRPRLPPRAPRVVRRRADGRRRGVHRRRARASSWRRRRWRSGCSRSRRALDAVDAGGGRRVHARAPCRACRPR